ncbi:MAG: Holliday junction resolvase RuvX [Pseudomonadota bacterium]
MPERTGTVLGFDFGTRRIGVAVGNTLTGTARPLVVLKANDGVPDWEQVAKLVAEWQPVRLIVGLPLHMDGTESELSARARKFANRLGGRHSLPVTIIDERLSSFEARGELLRDAAARGGGRAGQKTAVDALAAAVILETWLNERDATAGGSTGSANPG